MYIRQQSFNGCNFLPPDFLCSVLSRGGKKSLFHFDIKLRIFTPGIPNYIETILGGKVGN